MLARLLVIGKIYAQAFRKTAEGLVACIEEVLRTAVDVQRGQVGLLLHRRLEQVEQVVLAAPQGVDVAKNQPHLVGPLGLLPRRVSPRAAEVERVHIQHAREAGRCRVLLGPGQRQLERPIPAHRQPGDEVVLAPRGEVEELAHQRGQLVGDVVEVAPAVDHVGVVADLHCGHHHRQPQRRHVALDRRPPLPDGVIIRSAVQEPEDGQVARDGAARLANSLLPLGKNHVRLAGESEGRGVEGEVGEGHGWGFLKKEIKSLTYQVFGRNTCLCGDKFITFLRGKISDIFEMQKVHYPGLICCYYHFSVWRHST